ncbi:MAG TPA: GTPase [Thermoanaerobaculia bacterium]|nr:GTPase [Thermoanaerobaculia bacterium]
MVFFNASTRELTAKIVYYGPGLGGKTTNLKVLHQRLEPGTAGDLVALSTESDRTIYFDLLPVELGDIKGYRIRFQLTTVPGQTAFNETRRVVLKGADGVVFVADSQWTLLPKNLESWQSLKENLAANGLALDTTPVVIQYNKRDLPDILSVEAMQEALGFSAYPHVEAIASEGRGVTETFKLISKLTFLDLLRRLQNRPMPESIAAPHSEAAEPEAEEETRPSLTLVRSLAQDEPPPELDAPARAEEEPFPEARAPFEPPSADLRAEVVDSLRARLEEAERKLEDARESLAGEIAELGRRTDERVQALEGRLEAESSRIRVAQESLAEELGRLREHGERLEERASALAHDFQDAERRFLETADRTPRGPEDLKLQLAPILEEQVRRETDENWTAEIERLRQALAESLDDLSERVRKAVRG